MFAEHICKKKRGDNRPNECAGDNSSSSGRIVSSLWFNMMIDHLCPPAYPGIVMKVGETRASQSSSSSPQKTENILVCYISFIVKIHTCGPNPLTLFHKKVLCPLSQPHFSMISQPWAAPSHPPSPALADPLPRDPTPFPPLEKTATASRMARV